MAWVGKVRTRMSEKERRYFLRHSNRRLPRLDNPHGVPRHVMRTLANEGLSSNPAAYNARLQELLHVYKLNGD